jgi:ankyrin repeat protein
MVQHTAQLTTGELAEQVRTGNALAFQGLAEQEWARLVKLRDEDERSLLHTAAATNQSTILEAFLTNGGKVLVNVADEDGWTPLMSSSSSGYADVVQHLLACGANVAAVNSSERTALHYAASKGHARIVQLLLEAGVQGLVSDELMVV